MVLATTGMVLSVLGLSALFWAKWYEARAGHVFAPGLRARGDRFARDTKQTLLHLTEHIRHLPHTARIITRYFVYLGAKGTARFAQSLEHASHRVVEHISHKNRFERKVTTNEFLKKVRERRNELRNE